MDDVLILFTAAAVLVAILANIALWSPRRLRVKLGALVTAAVFLPLGYVAIVSLLGLPKPLDLEWFPPSEDDTTVLASQLREDEAIYIWVQRPDAVEPRAYVLPWSEQLARQLHEAQRSAETEGGTVQANLKAKKKNADPAERMFYSTPPPPPPPKALGDAGPTSQLTGRQLALRGFARR